MNITINLNGDLNLHLDAGSLLDMFEEDFIEDENADESEEKKEADAIEEFKDILPDSVIASINALASLLINNQGVADEGV